MKALRPRSDVDLRYLRLALESDLDGLLRRTRKSGTTVARLDTRLLMRESVPLPPLDEQYRLVAVLEDHLSRVDAAVLGLDRARQRAALLPLATFAASASSVQGLDTALGEIAHWGSGGTPRARDPRCYRNGTIPWVLSGDLRDAPLLDVVGRITPVAVKDSSAKWVPANAVLVAMYGATIGRTAMTTVPVTTNQAVAHAVPHETVLSEYLFWYMRAERQRLAAAGKGGAQPNISQTVLKSWPIRVPSRTDQQRLTLEAEEMQQDAERLAGAADAGRRRAAALRRALLTAAFSGRL